MTHAEEPFTEVVAMFDAEDARAVEWVARAEMGTPEVRGELAARRKGVVQE